MEILLWLVPAAVVTLIAMLWVSWLGREGRGEVDREVAVARLGRALEQGRSARRAPAVAGEQDRSTGVAVRPSRTPRDRTAPAARTRATEGDQTRRAS